MITEITRDKIMDLDEYESVRDDKRRDLWAAKKNRRVEVGPFANFMFENFDSIWLQIHEMLRIEKGGDAQITEELEAYNPMIPKGKNLSATLMFEISDPGRRDLELRKLGGVERTITLLFGGHTVLAVPDEDIERTTDDGKTSAVHFLHFHFSDEQIRAFKSTDNEIALGFGHSAYRHVAILENNLCDALSKDFS